MLRCALICSVAAAVVAAPSASAKGPFQVCGASGCAMLGSEAAQPPVRVFGPTAGTETIAARGPAPYFVLKFADFADALAYWVPSREALRIVRQSGAGSWVPTLAAEEAFLRERTASLTPYPAPTAVSASVDFEPVKRATGWLKLFTVGRRVAGTAHRAWYQVSLVGGRSPWTDGTSQIWISRRGNYLIRDGMMLTIPKHIADRVRRRLPLG